MKSFFYYLGFLFICVTFTISCGGGGSSIHDDMSSVNVTDTSTGDVNSSDTQENNDDFIEVDTQEKDDDFMEVTPTFESAKFDRSIFN